jgi:glycosyltransferase involved in cell wall biosynthesis
LSTGNAVPIRVAIDGTPLIGERTGIGHVTFQLLSALATRDDIQPIAFAVSRTGRDDIGRGLPPGIELGTSWLPARVVRPLWTRFDWPRIEHWTGPVDVVHATNFAAPPARAPVIVTIHDLTYAHSPDLVSEDTRRFIDDLVRRALRRGAVVHTVSEFVATEMRDHYDLAAERVRCVYPGLADVSGGDAVAGRRVAGTEQYLLALGQIEPRKNYPTLVRAFDRVAPQHPGVGLVIAGPAGWDQDAFDAACHAARARDRIRWLGYVSDDVRRDLLAGARGFVYPSRYEGFGHPPLEAMSVGVPTVSSNAGALPEILGDATLMVDVHDEQAFAAAISRLLADDGTRADLVARGRARVARYTWARAAGDFSALYADVAA